MGRPRVRERQDRVNRRQSARIAAMARAGAAMRFQGKVALVTGAGRGIGRGIAEAEGADVAIDFGALDDAEDQRPSAGRRALVAQADVASRAHVEPMFERVWRRARAGRHSREQRRHRDRRAVPRPHGRPWTRVVNVEICRAACALLAGVLPACRQPGDVPPHRPHRLKMRRRCSGTDALRPGEAGARGPDPQHGRSRRPGHPRQLHPPGLIDTPMTAWVMKAPEVLTAVLEQKSAGPRRPYARRSAASSFVASDEASYLTGQSLIVNRGGEVTRRPAWPLRGAATTWRARGAERRSGRPSQCSSFIVTGRQHRAFLLLAGRAAQGTRRRCPHHHRIGEAAVTLVDGDDLRHARQQQDGRPSSASCRRAATRSASSCRDSARSRQNVLNVSASSRSGTSCWRSAR